MTQIFSETAKLNHVRHVPNLRRCENTGPDGGYRFKAVFPYIRYPYVIRTLSVSFWIAMVDLLRSVSLRPSVMRASCVRQNICSGRPLLNVYRIEISLIMTYYHIVIWVFPRNLPPNIFHTCAKINRMKTAALTPDQTEILIEVREKTPLYDIASYRQYSYHDRTMPSSCGTHVMPHGNK